MPLTLFRRARHGSLALVLLGVALAAPAAGTPVASVETLNAALLAAMRVDGAAGFERRREVLEPVLRQHFDLDFIAAAVLGRERATLAEAQRAGFDAVFAELVVATYASRFKGYDGHRIDIVEERAVRGGRRLVRTRLIDGDGDAVSLDYLLQREGDGGWRVVNVVSGGVSDLALRRAEYTAIIERDGFEVLMRRLREQIARLRG